jgi:serine/threonine protein kinase
MRSQRDEAASCQDTRKQTVNSVEGTRRPIPPDQNNRDRSVRQVRLLICSFVNFCSVKLAFDLHTKKQVAIKILKTREAGQPLCTKYHSLESLHREISILAQCSHRNIVKIKAASFDGTIVKEKPDVERLLCTCEPHTFESVIKRQGQICYYVMKLAEYGELYRLVEMNHRLSDELVQYLFTQLVQGLQYLHNRGFVHRDIKPENLLIDRKFKLVIADFNFATRLEPMNKPGFPLGYNPVVHRNFNVGSEAYNAPELWMIEQREQEM